VTGYYVHEDSQLTDVSVRTGHTVSTIHTTQDHLFYDDTRRAWVNAADLSAGDRLHTPGPTAKPTVVVAVRNFTGSADRRDLTVTTLHTFYVIVAGTPVLVHNCPEGPVADASPSAGPKLYRAPHKGVDESEGLDPANFPSTGRHAGTAYLGDSEKVAQKYAGQGDYQEGYHEFTMQPGFLDDFHPNAFRRFHDDEGGLQWLIPQEDIELFNSHIQSVRWIPWRRGIEF
jgi:hypothetical protein